MTVKILEASSNQTHISSSWCLIFVPSKPMLNSSTKVVSHSNHGLLHLNFQTHLPSSHFPISQTKASFCSKFKNYLGKAFIRLPSPTEASLQNLIFIQCPTFHLAISSNRPSFSLPHTLFKSLHQNDSKCLTSPDPRPHQLPYFESRTFTQSASLLWNKFHFHFTSKATLNKEMSLIPNPSCSLGE